MLAHISLSSENEGLEKLSHMFSLSDEISGHEMAGILEVERITFCLTRAEDHNYIWITHNLNIYSL